MSSFESSQQQQTAHIIRPGDVEPSCSHESTPTTAKAPYTSFRPPPYQSTYHRYRTSTSSSTTSSPTTTSSLLGPPSSAETPGTSPDSAGSTNSYSGPFYQSTHTGFESRSDSRFGSISSNVRKPRNPKNLALNNLASPDSPPLGSAPLTGGDQADPSPQGIFSPAFVKPVPPRRKSTALGLTIQTPSSDSFAPTAKIPEVQIPPTPSLLRTAALRPFQSTPSLPLLASTVQPLPDNRPSAPQFTTSFTDFPVDETDELREPEGKLQRPEAYPDGPVCVYDPHVFLYYEPTAAEASEYDVVFNVASEVRNPFLTEKHASVRTADLKQAVEELSGERSFSVTSNDIDRQSSSNGGSDKSRSTEYFHIPWEHNSDMVAGTSSIPPLRDIIKVIDERVTDGKRVLIHCQLGVSRSASLVLAYGIYRNQTSTVQEVYEMVKQKSRWIGPNMGLIMQLQEYRNDLLRPSSAKGHQKSSSKVLHGRKDQNDPYASDASVPQTAPLPQDASPSKAPPSPLQMDNMPAVSAGPSSAPSEYHWPSRDDTDPMDPANNGDVARLTDKPVIDPNGRLLQEEHASSQHEYTTSYLSSDKTSGWTHARVAPVGSIQLPPLNLHIHEPTESLRSAEFAMSPLRPADDDPSFGITSPREATFANSPTRSSPQPLSSFATAASGLSMSPFCPPDDDVTLGLTSPRATGFRSQMPSYFETPSRIIPVQPSLDNKTSNADARSNLRVQLGFRNHPSADNLQAHSPAAPTALAAQPVRPHSPLVIAPPQEEPDFADALMSPRATEFTSNPFHDAVAAKPEVDALRTQPPAASKKTDELKPSPDDPRSPPSTTGISPIVRSINDILES